MTELKPVRITVDPGLMGTGVSVWDSDSWKEAVPPLECFNLNAVKGDWVQRAQSLTAQFRIHLSCRKVIRVYIEFPKFWEGSTKGRTAAVKGDILKLAFLVGCFVEACRQLGIKVTLIDAGTWNGQLSKSIVKARVKACIPGVTRLKPQTHSWDAIGIGLYAKGVCFK